MQKFQVAFVDDIFGDQTFDVLENEFILEAAKRTGILIPYSCRAGTCRTCMVQVISGDVEQTRPEKREITQAELADNRRLICTSITHSHAVLRKAPKRKWTD